jgi:uncharacterized membrane protein
MVRGDSEMRYKWLAAVSFLIVVFSFLMWGSPAVQNYLIQSISSNSDQNLFHLLIIFYSVFAILAIIPITIGMHLIQTSFKVLRSNRFPSPGMKVFHDTWVIRGLRAQLLGYVFGVLALLLIVGGSSIPFYFHSLLGELLLNGTSG